MQSNTTVTTANGFTTVTNVTNGHAHVVNYPAAAYAALAATAGQVLSNGQMQQIIANAMGWPVTSAGRSGAAANLLEKMCNTYAACPKHAITGAQISLLAASSVGARRYFTFIAPGTTQVQAAPTLTRNNKPVAQAATAVLVGPALPAVA